MIPQHLRPGNWLELPKDSVKLPKVQMIQTTTLPMTSIPRIVPLFIYLSNFLNE